LEWKYVVLKSGKARIPARAFSLDAHQTFSRRLVFFILVNNGLILNLFIRVYHFWIG
jgi:hypothetical protein